MDLKDVQAAIAALDRQQKQLMNKRKHRLKLAQQYTDEAKVIEKDLDDVQERWLSLIKKEIEMKGDGDGSAA